MMFLLIGCYQGNKLEEYKATAKTTIKTYVESKEQDIYNEENRTILSELVKEGNTAVDKASDRTQVDSAVTTAKEAIDTVLSKGYNDMEYKDIEPGFYSLYQAYTLGALKINDLKSIAYYRAGRFGNESIMDANFVPMPKSPEVLEAETVEQIKKDWIDWLIATGIVLAAPEYGVQVDAYHGTYNDCIVVVMGYVNGSYAAVVSQEFVGGVKFYYGNSQRIYVWKKH